ncbi:PAS domain S-box-containing protein [Rhizobiales bacterium GAS113]|nr:PAS domain S-box-containing protein [Rhizobiales bacterium GAS113]
MTDADRFAGETRELRRCIRDLVAFSTLPAAWLDHTLQQTVEAIAAAMFSMLDSEFVYATIPARSDEPAIEVLRTSRLFNGGSSALIPTVITEWQAKRSPAETTFQHSFGSGILRIISIPVGLQGDAILVAGSLRPDFPSEPERLLLRVGSNEAATALLRSRAQSDERRFTALLQRSSDFIGFANLDGVTFYLNPAGRDLVGLDQAEDLRRLHVLDFITPGERAWVRDEIWPLAIRHGRWLGEMKFHHFKTGAAIPFLNDWFVINDARTGRPVHMATISRDLSARKRGEEELRDLNESLEHRVAKRTAELAAANQRLSEGIKERERADARLQELQSELYRAGRLSVAGQMAAALAHELNQPLTAISNSIDTIRYLLVTDRIEVDLLREVLDEAAGQVLRAGQIIRRLRDFVSRGETARRVESVTSMIEDASALALANTEAFGAKVLFHFDPNGAYAFADRIQIQLVLTNLMRNALQAMAQSERRVLALTTSLIDEGNIEIAVADSGSGLSRDAATHLFEPFFSTKAEGMGLGLSLCHSIVEAHGSRLRYEPNPGGGTIFRFTLAAASTDRLGHAH